MTAEELGSLLKAKGYSVRYGFSDEFNLMSETRAFGFIATKRGVNCCGFNDASYRVKFIQLTSVDKNNYMTSLLRDEMKYKGSVYIRNGVTLSNQLYVMFNVLDNMSDEDILESVYERYFYCSDTANDRRFREWVKLIVGHDVYPGTLIDTVKQDPLLFSMQCYPLEKPFVDRGIDLRVFGGALIEYAKGIL